MNAETLTIGYGVRLDRCSCGRWKTRGTRQCKACALDRIGMTFRGQPPVKRGERRSRNVAEAIA